MAGSSIAAFTLLTPMAQLCDNARLSLGRNPRIRSRQPASVAVVLLSIAGSPAPLPERAGTPSIAAGSVPARYTSHSLIGKPLISTANITMQFGAKPLFENVSVKFGGGNRYGLIGANGCGK